MSLTTLRTSMIAMGVGIATAIAQSPAPAGAAQQSIAVENGIAAFHVSTTIPAIEVSGKSGALQARVQVRRDANGLKLEHIEAWVSPASIKTGMALRDDHMRKRIFTTSRGDVPDLRFESSDVVCPGVAPGHEATCAVSGTMAIRGVTHAFSIPLKVKQDGSGASFRAVGDGTVKLSDYGIEVPSQLGVKTSNEVNIHLDLTGKESSLVASSSGGR